MTDMHENRQDHDSFTRVAAEDRPELNNEARDRAGVGIHQQAGTETQAGEGSAFFPVASDRIDSSAAVGGEPSGEGAAGVAPPFGNGPDAIDALSEPGEQVSDTSDRSPPQDRDIDVTLPSGASTSTPHDPFDPQLERNFHLLSQRIAENAPRLQSGEAVRLAIILPMIQVLGYDVFDPREVVPGSETSGNYVDYAVFADDASRMLVSYSAAPTDPDTDQTSGLRHHMAFTGTPVGILTNGRIAAFYKKGAAEESGSVLLTFDLAAGHAPAAVHALTRNGWSEEAFFRLADTGRQSAAAYDAILAELQNPGEELVNAIENRMTRAGLDVDDRTTGLIEDQLSRVVEMILAGAAASAIPSHGGPDGDSESDDERRMTVEENAAFERIKEIASLDIDPSRVHARPAQSYVAVLLDDNNRRSIARIHFNSIRTKSIGTFVGKDETRNQISEIAAIDNLADKISARVRELVQ